MWQNGMALAAGEGSAARRLTASGLVLSETWDRTALGSPRSAGR